MVMEKSVMGRFVESPGESRWPLGEILSSSPLGLKPAEECSVNRIHLTAVFSERIARFRGITAQICASTTSMRLLPGRSVAVMR
jgi:hypothetical protein